MSVGVCTIVKVSINGQSPICGSPPPSEIPLGANLFITGGFASPYLHVYNMLASPFSELSVLPAELDAVVEAVQFSPAQDIVIVGGGRAANDKPYVYDISVHPWVDITETVIPAVWSQGDVKRIAFNSSGSLVFMATTNGELQVYDRNAGDDVAWTKQADSGFDNGNLINDEVDISIKDDYLAIGKRAFYGAGNTENPHVEVYDITTNPISLITDIIWQERGFNDTADCTGVSFHPSQDFLTAATQSDNSIRTATASYTEGPLAFVELDNFVTPEPNINSMGAARFSPDGRFVAYGAANSTYMQMYEATLASGNAILTFDQSAVDSSVREIEFSRDGAYMAVGMGGGNLLALFNTAGAVPVELTLPVTIETAQVNALAFSS